MAHCPPTYDQIQVEKEEKHKASHHGHFRNGRCYLKKSLSQLLRRDPEEGVDIVGGDISIPAIEDVLEGRDLDMEDCDLMILTLESRLIWVVLF
jgi:hypothetical protein